MEYVLHIIVVAGIYVGLAIALDLLIGHTGLLSLAHAAFYGLGAYTSALLSVYLDTPFLVSLVAGACLAILLSLLCGIIVLRLSAEAFAIGTFGLQMVLFSIYNNWMEMTKGPFGLKDIPRPAILGLSPQSHLGFSIMAVAYAVVAYLIASRASTSPFGRVLRAIREDEVLAWSFGKSTHRFKITVFALSAALAAIGGGIYAHYVTYIDPTSFTVMESVLVVSMVIIGGAASRYGAAVGAVVLVVFPELLCFLGLPGSVAANLRQILYGGFLVALMIWRPQGLLGTYTFSKGGIRG